MKVNLKLYKKVTMGEYRALQVAVFVMCGGGSIGQMAAEQPEAFYVDEKVGKLPYAKEKIEAAVGVLKTMRNNLGLTGNDQHGMLKLPAFIRR